MADPGSEPIAVVGAGLAGSLMALTLAEEGHRVRLFERRGDIRLAPRFNGRSINLALSERGISGLRVVGLDEQVVESTIPMRARYVHNTDGSISKQPYGKKGDAILSVDRRWLNEILLTAAEEHPNVEILFEQKLSHVNLRTGELKFTSQSKAEAGAVLSTTPILTVGADGAYSSVRAAMAKTSRFDYEQKYIAHGYKELSIPATADGDFALPPHYLHIWPRSTFMMIALPNNDKSFTVTVFMPFDAPEGGFDHINTENEVVAFMEHHFPDAVPLMPTLVEDWFGNPTGPLMTVRCSRYHHADNLCIIGDAAHAMVPFYGQGMNAALEDVRVLHELMQEFSMKDDRRRLLEAFSARRVADGHAICDLALYNYIEMRHHTASRLFLVRQRIEKFLHWLLPRTWVPLYTMVAFRTIPYAKAVQRRAWQDRVFSRGTKVLLAAVVLALGVFLRRLRSRL